MESNDKSKLYQRQVVANALQEEQMISLDVEVDTVEDDNRQDVREAVALAGRDSA